MAATPDVPFVDEAPREALIAELERLWENEVIHEENNAQFEAWTDAFFRAHGLAHLIKPYHDYIEACIDGEEDGSNT